MDTKNEQIVGQAHEKGQSQGVAAVAPGSVFELIELQQCDDQYFPLGIFPTLSEAVAAVDKYGVRVCNNDPDEWAGVEIKERRFGLSDNGRTVWKRSWERDWSDEATERWKIIGSSPNGRDEPRRSEA